MRRLHGMWRIQPTGSRKTNKAPMKPLKDWEVAESHALLDIKYWAPSFMKHHCDFEIQIVINLCVGGRGACEFHSITSILNIKVSKYKAQPSTLWSPYVLLNQSFATPFLHYVIDLYACSCCRCLYGRCSKWQVLNV